MDQAFGNGHQASQQDTRGAVPYVLVKAPTLLPAARNPALASLAIRDLLGLLDRMPGGLAVIDGRGLVAHLNAAAHTIVRRGDGLTLLGGRLRTLSQRLNRTLDSFLGAGRASGASPADTLALRVERSRALPAYRVVVAPLPGHGSTVGDAAVARYSVLIHERRSPQPMPAFLLIDLYGLSRAEARLAARLYQGDALADAARAQNITVATARTHLRHIFAKCEVQSQAELLQLLALGPQT